MEMTNWKTLYKKESWGGKNFGIEVRVAIDRNFNDNDERAMYRIGDQIEDAVMRESMRLDPEQQASKLEERTKLLECFPDERVFVKEIPNGYSNQWYYEMSPWYEVTTGRHIDGVLTAVCVTLGWRKRVIEITWDEKTNAATADELFPGEDVTRDGRMIHAWSYEKAKQYIAKILS